MKKIVFSTLFLLTLLTLTLPQKALASENIAGSSAALQKQTVRQEMDPRTRILRDFLKSYNSPLADSAGVFVQTADKNKLDWKLVAAISGVESTFGHQIPYNSYNAWGWGIYGDNRLGFASFDEGITTISKSLREDYMNRWKAQDVSAIGKIYAASPTWSSKVTYFMNKIDSFAANDPSYHLSLSI